ncbi:MAG: site-specific integrase [Alphaproteobacteria bacterium]
MAEIIAAEEQLDSCKTIGEIIRYYANHHIPTTSRPDVAIANLEKITPFWGMLTLKDISQAKSLSYYEFRKKEFHKWQIKQNRISIRTLQKQSVRRELEQLQAAVNFAYREGAISVQPYIYKFEKSKPRNRWLTRSEAAALIWNARKSEQAKEYLPLFILIGIYTGARMSAILNLRWNNVDLNKGIIDFSASNNSETKQGAKTVIPKKLLLRLVAHRQRGNEEGYILHINQSPIGSPKKSFKTACIRAKLEDVTIHTLRHTCASWLIQKNVSTDKIAKHLGHTSPRMIEQTYGHLSPDHLQEVMDAFS